MNKKLILAIFIIFVSAVGIYQAFIKKEKPPFTLAEVFRGNIAQEVSETGQVKKGEEINLNFKSAGRVEKIYVEVGEAVKSGEKLVKLDTTGLLIQLQEAEAVLKLAQAKFDKLLAGSSPEEIKIAETEISNTQVSLTTAQENLDQALEDAIPTLDDSYLKTYNAFNVVDLIQRTYFTSNDQEGIEVRENKDKIEEAMSRAKPYLDIAKSDPKDENIEVALSQIKDTLVNVFESLGLIREVCETSLYRNIVSSSNKTSLDNQRTYINTALTNITNSQQTISSMRSSVEAAEGKLQAAKDQLSLVISEPRQEDIDLHQAQVNQAKAQVKLLENQIQEAILTSPTNGQIIKIYKETGEMVQSTLSDTVISLIPSAPFQIEVDVPEVDIGKVNLENFCKITIDAFPEKEFSGQIIEIDPAETVISGVVYYKTRVSLDSQDPKIKIGMTANVTIITERKENVLIIPQRAVIEKGGKKIVRTPLGNTFKEVEVQTGLRGSRGEIEIISGLKEGDKVITFIKESD